RQGRPVRAAGGLPLPVRARHPGGEAEGALERGGQDRPPRPGDGGAAGDRLRVQRGARRPAARRADRRPRPRREPPPGRAGARRLWVGRTYADAPEVDGVTYVRGSDLEPGDLVACEVVASQGYDTVATAGPQPPRRRRARPKARRRPSSPFTILS